MSKNITLAKHAGFCYGVKRAVETVKKLKSENPDKEIFILGQLIHNSQVINELEELGIHTVNELPKDSFGICVVRSHGATPSEMKAITDAGFELVDLTCPDVKKVQQKAIQLVKDGNFLVIVGKSAHPEVLAIRANAAQYGDSVVVATTVDELKPFEEKIKSHRKVGVVVQTTQTLSTLQEIVTYLTSISKELHVMNTICASTTFRQNEAKELAKENDLIVVVGSKNSANTTHLAEILLNITKTIHVENEEELDKYKDIIKKSQKIAITAGASTPQNLIDNVLKTIEGGQ